MHAQEDWRIRFVELCYRAPSEDRPEILNDALELLRLRIDSAMANLLVLDGDGHFLEQIACASVPKGMMEDYVTNFRDLDPWPRLFEVARLAPGEATTTTHMDLRKEVIPTTFYQEFWSRWGLHHSAGGYYPLPNGRVMSSSLPRFAQDGNFLPKHVADLQFGCDHLARAVGILLRMRETGFALRRHASFDDRLDVAVFHVTAQCALQYANALGRRLLASTGLFRLRDGVLRLRVAAQDAAFVHAVSEASELVPRARVIQAVDMGGRSWLLNLIPLSDTAATVAVVAADMTRLPTANEALAVHGDLTQAESDVLYLLLELHGNEEIARRRGTSMHTVRSQVKSIQRKLSVRSISQLIALAARVGISLR